MAPAVLDIAIGTDKITVTPEHEFWVIGEGWKQAKELWVGAKLLTKDSKEVRIEWIGKRTGEFRVYNFSVTGTATYFVGKTGVLVHNCDLPFNVNGKGTGGYGINNLPKDPNDLVSAGWKEITDPRMAANSNRRVLQDPATGLAVEFDKGSKGLSGNKAIDHYSVPNPNSTTKINSYLDVSGNGVPRGSKGSHIFP